ncbi:hypothetical protein D3C71_1854560 [compost metagenome]
MHGGNRKTTVDLIQRDFGAGIDGDGLEASLAEDHRKGHGETACVSGADQFFRVGAWATFETRLKAIGCIFQDTGFGRDRTQAGFQIADPMRRCSLLDAHLCLLTGASDRALMVFGCQGF